MPPSTSEASSSREISMEGDSLSSLSSSRSRRTRRAAVKKNVAFLETVHVQFVKYWTSQVHITSDDPSSCSVSDIWYTSKDFAAMMIRDSELCHRSRGGNSSSSKEDSRWGLETKSVKIRRRKRMHQAELAVLSEQAKQWERESSSSCSLATGSKNIEDAIFRAFEPAAEEARADALDRGVKLATALCREEYAAMTLAGDVADLSFRNENDLATFSWSFSSPASPTAVSDLPLSSLAVPCLASLLQQPKVCSSDDEDCSYPARSTTSQSRWAATPQDDLFPPSRTPLESPSPSPRIEGSSRLLPLLPIRK